MRAARTPSELSVEWLRILVKGLENQVDRVKQELAELETHLAGEKAKRAKRAKGARRRRSSGS